MSVEMAGAQSGVHVVQLKPIVVPPALLEGNKCVKWDDVSLLYFSVSWCCLSHMLIGNDGQTLLFF